MIEGEILLCQNIARPTYGNRGGKVLHFFHFRVSGEILLGICLDSQENDFCNIKMFSHFVVTDGITTEEGVFFKKADFKVN